MQMINISGTFGEDIFDASRLVPLGMVTVSVQPRFGNPMPVHVADVAVMLSIFYMRALVMMEQLVVSKPLMISSRMLLNPLILVLTALQCSNTFTLSRAQGFVASVLTILKEKYASLTSRLSSAILNIFGSSQPTVKLLSTIP